MMNRFFILTPAHQPSLRLHDQGDLLNPAVLLAIDMQDRQQIDNVTRMCFSGDITARFVICLRNLHDPGDLNEVLVLLSHRQYFRVFNQPVVFLECDGNFDRKLVMLKEFLDNQGFEQPRISGVNSKVFNSGDFIAAHMSDSDQVVLSELVEFEKYYTAYLGSQFNADDYFIVQPGTVPADQFLKRMKSLIDLFRTAHPYEAGLIKRLVQDSDTAQVETLKNKALESEIKVMDELARLRSGNKELEDILEFYHREYEVLPLWYKRVGHILKVVMGKRSFKSLFSDKKQR